MRPSIVLPWLLAAALVVLGGCPTHTSDTGDTGTDTGDTGTADTGSHPGYVRVVTWNIENGVGAPGSSGYNATRDVLKGLDGDVVMLEEIANAGDIANLRSLASDLGLPTVVAPSTNPFGDLRNGAMTRLNVVASSFPDSKTLSSDSQANDLTRLPIELTVDVPGSDQLTVIGEHWKSGFCDSDKFRRAVDGLRVGQAVAAADPQHKWVLAVGDFNADVAEVPESPATFTAFPTDAGQSSCYGMPGSYYLGSDLYSQMHGGGIADNAFTGLIADQMQYADARQQDGTTPTRPTSGRRIDYIWYSPAIPSGWQAEVFNCEDQSDGGLALAASVPGDRCRLASDHLPVVIDIPIR